MERQGTDRIAGSAKAGIVEADSTPLDNQTAGEMAEDVAILYSWANLEGAKYRDFSASRREYRAQMRRRAAETVREQELKAAAEAEVAAGKEEDDVAEAGSRNSEPSATDPQPGHSRPLSRRDAEIAARAAAAERGDAARRAEAAVLAEAAALRADRESAEIQDNGRHPAARHEKAESRLPQSAPGNGVPGQMSDPYLPKAVAEGEYFERPGTPAADLSPSHLQQQREYIERATGREIAWDRPLPSAADVESRLRSRGFSPADPSGPRRLVGDDEPAELRQEMQHWTGVEDVAPAQAPPRPPSSSQGPPWLDAPAAGSRFQPAAQAAPAVAGDTLQHSRERVAERWFALKGVFQRPGLEIASELHPQRQQEVHAPILAVFSLAGGVGKTSLVATLGRALSALGEQVLLADTTSHGLLPFYFGASELIPGAVRNFLPPPGSKNAPIHMVAYDVDRRGEIQTREDRRSDDAGAQDKLAADLLRDSQGVDRVLLDLPATSSWVVRRVARMNPTVLIPLAPDMNSVITLQSVNQFLESIQNAEGHPLSPYFLLNQFDPSLPLHIDVREVLRQQLGERLLPFVIHRTPAISEALAEGMTILDYAPEAAAVQDYLNVATWIRSVSASVSAGLRHVRWSER